MARTNKYNSLNFNDIYEKKIGATKSSRSSSSSISSTTPSTNKTVLSNSRIHGNMLVLSRPSPKPIVSPRQPSPPPATQPPDQPPVESDSISLRPLGRTGLAPPLSHLTFPLIQSKDSSVLPKTNRFVPPHLRPGFHGREVKLEPEIQKQTGCGMRSNIRQGLLRSPIYKREEGRPKSGGGYERVTTGFEGNPKAMNRPRSSGSTRPYSSG
ncbi:uncharacterized protein LOC112522417 [Cynara cardunculus var. scolymus]|uniref:Uncharacterized protein n=1 Tax=Cynara cardunculus var. scolymus TaxID=59895 RepID=A0A103XVB4_CYNCS|nr:uncharacterized protein LOC112522417 [Cynara cardunculus var. scolymus]KVH97562.1 hypothetical protein Ccrd_000317 [Cynara cardunculus var. scolymus]